MKKNNVYIFGPNSSIAEEISLILNSKNIKVRWVGSIKPYWADNSKDTFHIVDYDSPNFLKQCNDFINDISNVVFLGSPMQQSLLHNTSDNDMDRILRGSIANPLKLLTRIIPNMINANYGRIIFIGSSIAEKGVVGSSIYALAKSSYRNLAKSLAREYGIFGLTFNVLNLGYLDKGMADTLSEKRRKEFLARTSNEVPVDSKEIGEWLHKIIESKSLNGATIELDGGFI